MTEQYQHVHLGPDDEYRHFDLGKDSSGRELVMNGRTIAMLDEADRRLGFDLSIVQGSYQDGHGSSLSGSTHDAGGVIDIRTRDLSPQDRDQALLVLRQVGFAAWYRHEGEFAGDEHFHAVSIGDTDLDPSAAAQVEAYRAGGDGLAGDIPDDGPRVAIHPFDYEAFVLGTAGGDSFAPDAGSPITQTNQDDDGLTDEFERLLGTDPTKADTDHDGLSDVVETTQTHTDPLVANDPQQVAALLAHPGSVADHEARIPIAALKAGFGGGATLDSDHDGLSDLTEVQIGSDPYQADTDHDGVSDGIEHRLGSNLLSMDTDNDGIVDSVEYDHGSLEAALPDLSAE